ncbi:TonB-dependent receptor, partial [Fontimonas sp. SYSU GA230001]|uniref:TonB-dependent receptor domain-containing protein n=1 Tax=Fontimonas sp. SYSU GA230001 TaxID=3142450 RepID=UPI0032B33C74
RGCWRTGRCNNTGIGSVDEAPECPRQQHFPDTPDYLREARDTDLQAILGTGRFVNTTSLAADDEQAAWRVGGEFEEAARADGRRLWRLYATRARIEQDSDEFRERADPPVRQQREFVLTQHGIGGGLDGRQSFAQAFSAPVLGYGVDFSFGRIAEGRDALQTRLDDGSQTNVLLGETFPRRDFPLTELAELGAYLNGELHVPDTAWIVMPGLRYDVQRLDARRDARFDNGSSRIPVTDLRSHAWTPRLGVLFPLTADLRGFAQYAQGFRAPPPYDVNLGIDIVAFNARALPNPDLRPERSDAHELGVRYRGRGAVAELSLFETRYEDFILSNAFVGTDPETGTRLFQSRNVERAWIRGVELRWRQDLAEFGAPSWLAELSAAWLRGENRDSDQPLPTIDPARLVLGLDRQTDTTALRLRLTAADRQSRVDDAAGPQFRAPGYAVCDLIGEYRPLPRLVLRAGVFNALDRRYWEWGDVYGRSPDDPTLPLLARAGRYLSASLRFTY